MFNTISARQIQREYKKVLKDANDYQKPIVVVSNNKPIGAIIGLKLLERLQLEFLVKQALEESKTGETVTISTEQELAADLKELEQHASTQI